VDVFSNIVSGADLVTYEMSRGEYDKNGRLEDSDLLMLLLKPTTPGIMKPYNHDEV
jgi:hypothetical protein